MKAGALTEHPQFGDQASVPPVEVSPEQGVLMLTSPHPPRPVALRNRCWS